MIDSTRPGRAFLPIAESFEQRAPRPRPFRAADPGWIAVRPVRLTDGSRTSHYRVVMDGLPMGGTSISRADVADFMLKQLTSNEYVHRVPTIAY